MLTLLIGLQAQEASVFKLPVKLRIENLEIVVIRDAGCRHLIDLEAVRQSCALHSADYAV